MSTTRLTLQRDIADKLGDLIVLTATAAGSTTTLKDTTNLYEPDNHFKGRTAYVVSGTAANVGLIRTVTGSAQGASTVTVTPDLLAVTAIGDVMDLYNERAMGWTVQEIRRAIDRAVIDAYPFWLDAAVVDGTTAFDANVGRQTIPGTGGTPTTPNLEWLNAVEIKDADGFYHPIPRATRRNNPGYFVNLADASITVGGRWTIDADGQILRYHGHIRPAALTTDASETLIDPEWLVAKAMSDLLHSGIQRDVTRERLYNHWVNREEFLRKRLIGSRPPNSERCREA